MTDKKKQKQTVNFFLWGGNTQSRQMWHGDGGVCTMFAPQNVSASHVVLQLGGPVNLAEHNLNFKPHNSGNP